jgi:raffinose/stachyose/melibiose transport system permease protein
VLGRVVSYTVFTSWALITVLPLVWMLYSSFKSNDELIRNPFLLPHDLFDNRDDEYLVIPPALNVILPYDPEVDKRDGDHRIGHDFAGPQADGAVPA